MCRASILVGRGITTRVATDMTLRWIIRNPTVPPSRLAFVIITVLMRGHALRVAAHFHVIRTVLPRLCSFVSVQCIYSEWDVLNNRAFCTTFSERNFVWGCYRIFLLMKDVRIFDHHLFMVPFYQILKKPNTKLAKGFV